MQHHHNEQFPMELSSQLVSIFTTEHYTLVLMGLITFERVLQSGSTDYMYAHDINRLRRLYLEYAPQLQPYFMSAAHDDRGETLSREEMSPSWVQVFFNAAGMIAVINSVLIGSFVGLLLAVFSLPLWACTSTGVVAFLGSVVLQQRYQWGQWIRLERTLPPLSKPPRRAVDERRGLSFPERMFHGKCVIPLYICRERRQRQRLAEKFWSNISPTGP